MNRAPTPTANPSDAGYSYQLYNRACFLNYG